MADKVRFAPGGARPAPAQTVAVTRTELFPGVDRPTMVLWLGVSLIVASELVDYGPLRAIWDVSHGKSSKASMGWTETSIEIGLIAFLYVLALASDNSGTVAVLIVVALWVAWLVRHAQAVQGFLAPAANANAAPPKASK